MHFSASLIIGIFFANAFNEPAFTLFGALLGGFFIDGDHLFDHWIVLGIKNFKLKDFFAGKSFKKSNKVYVLFHGWEYPLLISFVTFAAVTDKASAAFLIAFAVSLLAHLIIDTLTNEVKPLGYSVLYRVIHNFDKKHITTKSRRRN
ncbi:MAG: hypothetical protein HQK77_21635 [Desulfobacterales bacterium]|nr:hypothetical protein [Desulfobacterales bacterium]